MYPFLANPRTLATVWFVAWSSLLSYSFLAQLHDHSKQYMLLLSSALTHKKCKLFIYLVDYANRIANSKEMFFQAEITMQNNIMVTDIHKKLKKWFSESTNWVTWVNFIFILVNLSSVCRLLIWNLFIRDLWYSKF